MFESSYILDAGSYALRLYDPKTKSIVSMPACMLSDGSQAGIEALAHVWDENRKLLWPFWQETIQDSPAALLKALFAKASPERFYLVPSIQVLSFQQPDAALARQWNELLIPYHFGRVDIVPAFIPEGNDGFFHIHAGHSLVHFVMGTRHEVLAYKALPVAGRSVDQAIIDEIARVFKVLITPEDACTLKETVSRALHEGRNPHLSVTGLGQKNDYERVSFRAADLWGCMEAVLLKIAQSAAEFVCSQGAELMEDVLASSARVSGGLALCYGFVPLLARSLHADVRLVSNPETWVIDAMRACRPSRRKPGRRKNRLNTGQQAARTGDSD